VKKMAYPQFALLFDSKEIFDKKVVEFNPLLELFEKSLKLPPQTGSNVILLKEYKPFKISQKEFSLMLVRPYRGFYDSGWESKEGLVAAEKYFENVLIKKMIGGLEPDYFVVNDSKYPETVFEYDIEYSTNNWRLALSPHPFDYPVRQDALLFDKERPLLFDHTRTELATDTKTLQEHLTETELHKLIKKFSIRYFEDSKGNTGTMRYHEREYYENEGRPKSGLSDLVCYATPNFWIRRKLRREGVKLYFGALEMALLAGGPKGHGTQRISDEPFGEIFSEGTQEKLRKIKRGQTHVIPNEYCTKCPDDTKPFWSKARDVLTEQEHIDFGLNGDFKPEKKSWWKFW